jgi:hypothetical protein
MLATILNSIHFFVLIIPFLIYLVPFNKNINRFYKHLILLLLLTPLHWKLCGNKCFLTYLTQQTGDLQNTKTTSPFTEKYMRWLYEPIMKYVFHWEWNSTNIEKMVNVNWILIFIAIWYYIFYYNPCICR